MLNMEYCCDMKFIEFLRYAKTTYEIDVFVFPAINRFDVINNLHEKYSMCIRFIQFQALLFGESQSAHPHILNFVTEIACFCLDSLFSSKTNTESIWCCNDNLSSKVFHFVISRMIKSRSCSLKWSVEIVHRSNSVLSVFVLFYFWKKLGALHISAWNSNVQKCVASHCVIVNYSHTNDFCADFFLLTF